MYRSLDLVLQIWGSTILCNIAISHFPNFIPSHPIPCHFPPVANPEFMLLSPTQISCDSITRFPRMPRMPRIASLSGNFCGVVELLLLLLHCHRVVVVVVISPGFGVHGHHVVSKHQKTRYYTRNPGTNASPTTSLLSR